jgi:4'-phosphopantetheinyl transferase
VALVWGVTSTYPELGANEVHIWRANLALPARAIAKLAPTLTLAELERAKRLRSAQAAQSFIAARGFLRQTLAAYLALAPNQLHFGYTQLGKPFLLPNSHPTNPLHFNLSHSHGLGLLAITNHPKGELGLDLEYTQQELNIKQVANSFFLPSEVEALASQTPTQQRQTFFQYWTVKEAYFKACGQNLTTPLQPLYQNQTVATLDKYEGVPLQKHKKYNLDAKVDGKNFSLVETLPQLEQWQFWHFASAQHYVSTIALARNVSWEISGWEWL